jgi:uncharacterized protein (TIGR02145 family)
MKKVMLVLMLAISILILLGSCKKEDDKKAETGTFTDPRDGQTYSWVKIGTQEWMAENLKFLPSVANTGFGSSTEPHYYVYDYNGTDVHAAKATANFQNYGVLYNWPAAISACPSGWRLPTDADWTVLTNFAGGENVAGGKLKSTRTAPDAHPRWMSPNTDATDVYGFSALPGGVRLSNENFGNIEGSGWWWCATELDDNRVWIRQLPGGNKIYRFDLSKNLGSSVRCIRE